MIEKNECTKTKLSAFSLGIAFSITEGLFMMLFAWAAGLFGYGIPMIHNIATVCYGYAPSFVGGLFGGVGGLIDGFIFGIVVGWIYNFCLCHVCKKSSS